MSYKQQIVLIDRLADKTRSGELDWKPAVEEASYQVSLKKNSVLLRMENSSSGNPSYHLHLFDSNGVDVETFSDFDIDREMFGEADRDYYRKMRDLYESVRRRVLGADKVLNDILKSLE